MPKPRSAPAKGIRVTFSDLMHDMLRKWDVSPFYDDHIHNGAPPSSYGSLYEGRLGLYHAFDAAKGSGTGWSMVVSPVVLNYLTDEVVPLCLDLIDAGGGEWDDLTDDSLWLPTALRFHDRMKVLRAKVRAAQ